MRDAALQFVRKISGYTHPSKANEAAFEDAVEEVEKVVRKLLGALETDAPRRTARSSRPRRASGPGSDTAE